MKLLNTKIKNKRPTAFLSRIKDLAMKYTNVTTATLASTTAPKAALWLVGLGERARDCDNS